MATSFSDMMNDNKPVYYESASYHDHQMMTSGVALGDNTTNDFSDPHHMLPSSTIAAAEAPGILHHHHQEFNNVYAQPAFYHHDLMGSVPIVKSQAGGSFPMVGGGFVYNPTTTPSSAESSPSDACGQPTYPMMSYQQSLSHASSPATVMMDWVDYPNIDAAHQMMPNTLLPVTAAAMGGVQDYAMPPPTNVYPMTTEQQQGCSSKEDDDGSSPQPPSQRTKRRQPLPRRHTVSTPYHTAVNKSSDVLPEVSQASNFRKYLKAKRHRSLCKLEMPPSSPDPGSKWLSPDTASSASSLCSPIIPGQTANDLLLAVDHDPMVLLDTLQQRQPSEPPKDEENENFTCLWESCYKELYTLEALILHVKEQHIGSGKALYYCGWKDCPRNDKPFTKRHKMHNHLRTHTGERPFECTVPGCGKRFSRPDSLTTHAKIHSNVRPYLCRYGNCGKAYYHLRSLRKHEKTHEEQQTDPVVKW